MQKSLITGLSKPLLEYIDITSFKPSSECCCNIIIKEDSLSKSTGAFDDGLLIALVDTFSSYCLIFLLPNENYQHFLSVNINMTSYSLIKPNLNEKQPIIAKVSLVKQWGRNVLLEINIYYNGVKVKTISHLKRKISSKL